MTYVLDPVAVGWVLLGLLLGLLLGRLVWRRTVVARVADSATSSAALNAARSDADRRANELAAAQAAMRPLTDEVDRLKRELAKAQRPLLPVADPPAAAPSVLPHVAATPAVAGAGPIVVGPDDDTITAGGPHEVTAGVPDIRRLKGVGDKFAAALGDLGLGSVDRLARLTPDEAADADTRLGVFDGRIARDRLVEQATLIDEGRMTEFEARFGRLG